MYIYLYFFIFIFIFILLFLIFIFILFSFFYYFFIIFLLFFFIFLFFFLIIFIWYFSIFFSIYLTFILVPGNVNTGLTELIHLKRWRKTKNEKEILTKAAKISTSAFISTMKASKPNIQESFLDALLEFECIKG